MEKFGLNGLSPWYFELEKFLGYFENGDVNVGPKYFGTGFEIAGIVLYRSKQAKFGAWAVAGVAATGICWCMQVCRVTDLHFSIESVARQTW